MLSYRQLKKIAIAVIGGTVVLLGVALLVLPGPAILVIPAGLAILATEFAWARSMLHRARDFVKRSGSGSSDASDDSIQCELSGWRQWRKNWRQRSATAKKQTPADSKPAGEFEKGSVGRRSTPLPESH